MNEEKLVINNLRELFPELNIENKNQSYDDVGLKHFHVLDLLKKLRKDGNNIRPILMGELMKWNKISDIIFAIKNR